MKSKHLFFTLLSFLCVFQTCFSQDNKSPILVDEVEGIMCGDQLKARLDNLIFQINQHPQSNLYINFYGGMSEGINRQYLGFFKHYLSFKPYLLSQKSISEDKLFIARGKNQEKMKIQMWIVPDGATPIEPESKFDEQDIYVFKPELKNATLFYKVWFDIHSSDYGESGGGLAVDACPVSTPTDFAKALLKNPYLTGYLVVPQGENKGWAKKASKRILKDVNKLKISQNRLQTIYAESEGMLVELWLVPKGSTLPKAIKKNTN